MSLVWGRSPGIPVATAIGLYEPWLYNGPMEQIILLTGPRGIGKTTACQDLTTAARSRGLSLGGVIAPARYDDKGRKIGSDIIALANGRRRHLAVIDRATAHGHTVGSYCFDETVFAWAQEQVMSDLLSPQDLVIIDEIGRLEMLQNKGFAAALDILPQSDAHHALLVVRQSVLTWTQGRLPGMATTTIHMDEANRHLTVSMILDTYLSV